MNSTEQLTIGELAKRSRVNLETIRYYERQELLPKPPRLKSGYRAFPVESVQHVRFIKQAQELGFSLKEVKELLSLRAQPGSSGSDVRKRVEVKIADIEEKMKTLKAIKSDLVQLMATCKGTATINDCPIMERLNAERE